MRAAVIHAPGTSPRTGDVPDAVAPDGRHVITVLAAPLPPIELLIASGTSYFGVPACPYVPGLQGVGEAADGRRLLFATSAGLVAGESGGMAERCAVDPARTMDIGDADPVVAAALGNSAPAALGALRRGRLSPDDTVIVLGASGTVGQVAIQAAKAAGATVVAVARGADGCERARVLGADAAVDAADGDVDRMAADLTEACAGQGSLVIDPVAGAPAAAALRALAPGGRLVNLGDSAGPLLTVPSALLRSRTLEILGHTNLALGWDGQSALVREALAMVADGRLTIDIEAVGLEEAESAWDRMAAGGVRARLVLVP